MAFVEDFSVFFNDGTPGYVVAEIDGEDVGVLFDSPFQEVNFIESSNPIVYVKTADIAGVEVNAVLMNGATEYRVIGIEPDGTGISKLELRLRT